MTDGAGTAASAAKGADATEGAGMAATRTTRRSPLRRILAPVAIGVAAVAGALAVIVWLPLDAQVEADVKDALAGYEISREVAWPATKPVPPAFSQTDEAALAEELRRGLSRHAAGDALAGVDATAEAARFLSAADADRPWIVTKWDVEVVYFDFVRQTLRGELIVRAGVRRAHQVGRANAQKQGVVARRWVWDDGADVVEYRLSDDGDAWKVVAATHWGVCGPEGQDIVETRERF